MASPDVRVLEEALRVMSRALDTLVGQCMDESGRPKAPNRGDLMRARAMLPPGCTHALSKRAPQQP